MTKQSSQTIRKGDRVMAQRGGHKYKGTAVGISRPTKEGPRWIYVQWDDCNYGDLSNSDAILEIDARRI